MNNVPATELVRRIAAFKSNLTKLDPEWNVTFIFTRVNTIYFTGTSQNGALCIPRDGDTVFYVRKSYERALEESTLDNIVQFRSFKEIPKPSAKTVHIETEGVPLAHYERFNRYMGFESFSSCDLAISQTRAVKSEYEMELIKKAGQIHQDVFDNVIPAFLSEGISEAELGAHALHEAIKRGHQGITRMGGYNAELYFGQVCFGENSNYYNPFDGPAGVYGVSPAVPLFGNHNRKLKRGEIVLVDTACGYNGYHTDKTAIYSIGKMPAEVHDIHKRCVDIQNSVAEAMTPGAIPSEIYSKMMAAIDKNFDEHFMGYGSNKVKFLAHGIGLVVDEYPVIANGFNEPLEENVVMAIEPKRGIKGLGMVGIENTFVVTINGGKPLTGTNYDIFEV